MTPRNNEHDKREVLRDGELTVLGRIRSASNATFLCESTLDERSVHCVYKPVSGEQPLWDFPDGTLAGRELAAYLVSTHLGWNIVPYTIIRHGPAGPGMLQLWVEQPSDTVASPDSEADSEPRPGPDLVDLFPADKREPGYLPVLRAYDYAGDEVMLMHADDIRLWRMAVFDVLINNADRKGGHVLRDLDGHIYGVDHGLCLHVENKLRTVLWGWAGKPVDDKTLTAVAGLADALSGTLGEELDGQITRAEIAALHRRACALLDKPIMPGPNRHRAIPWPAF
ncbi:MAG: SCO1664 family protein [Mycobacterium sp.]|uniref:SCO1664 family protein n=1 Tax=Mycobacterium sp. TaxID=1785 RepID=UPI003C662145